MKKFLFSMAAVATVLFVAACGNKEAKGNDSDSVVATETEQVAEEQDNTIKGPNTLDLNMYSVKVPEGWYVKSTSDNDCTLEPLSEKENGSSNAYLKIVVWKHGAKQIEDRVKTYMTGRPNAKKMNPLTLDGMTFEYYCGDKDDDKSSFLVHKMKDGEGRIDIDVRGFNVEDAPIQEILNSIKMK